MVDSVFDWCRATLTCCYFEEPEDTGLRNSADVLSNVSSAASRESYGECNHVLSDK